MYKMNRKSRGKLGTSTITLPKNTKTRKQELLLKEKKIKLKYAKKREKNSDNPRIIEFAKKDEKHELKPIQQELARIKKKEDDKRKRKQADRIKHTSDLQAIMFRFDWTIFDEPLSKVSLGDEVLLKEQSGIVDRIQIDESDRFYDEYKVIVKFGSRHKTYKIGSQMVQSRFGKIMKKS